MLWIFLAITAHFFWALVNIGDKYVLVNKIKNPYVYMVWLAMFGIITVLLIPFTDFVFPDIKQTLLLLLAAGVYFYGGFPYVKAMQQEEVTRINVWWNLIPIFSFFIAWFFIDETLTSNQLLAFTLLIVGAVIASLHWRNKKIVFSKSILLMLLACLAYAIYAVILRYITQQISFISAFIWVNLMMLLFIPSLLYKKKFRSDFIFSIKQTSKMLFLIIFIISILDLFGIMFNLWALSLGPVSLVFAMEGWQVIFVFILSLFISFFRPQALQEELDKHNILLKGVAMIIMIVGIILVNLS